MKDIDGNTVEDTKVEHGRVRIKMACGIGEGYTEGNSMGYFQIEQGTAVTIELLPDYGYQFKSGSINGQAIPTAQEEVATYKFNMPANQLHLSAIFTKTEDNIIIDNSDITAASIDNLAGQISGNAEFKVEEVEDINEEKFETAADGAKIVGFTELSLNEVILKGNPNAAWKTPVTDLNEEMKVSLKVSDEMAKELENGEEVEVLRDHNGTVTKLDATYNKETQELEFNTDGYSTYAIAYSAKVSEAKSENKQDEQKTDTVKTGDMLLVVTISIIILVIVANIIINRRKAEKRR